MTVITRFEARIRFKALAAVLVLVAIIGAIGATGYHYINAVARSVTVTTQRTSPLLASALSASEAMRRLAASVRDIRQLCRETGNDSDSINPSWGKEFDAIDRLQIAASNADVGRSAQLLGEVSNGLFHALWEINTLCRNGQRIAETITSKQREALDNITQLNTLVVDLALALDGEMALNEDQSKVALQIGESESLNLQSLLDVWPTLRALYKLHEYTHQLEDVVAGGTSGTALNLDDAAVSSAKLLDVMTTLAQSVAPRLRSMSRAQDAARLIALVETTNDTIKSASGLERLQSSARRVDGEAEQKRSELHDIEVRLAGEMGNIEQEARTLDAAAQAQMTATIGEATTVIGMLAAIAAMGTLLGSLIFIDRLTQPIEALTSHIRRVQATRDADQPVPPELLSRNDEIGRLAVSFNDMSAALANARHSLLAEQRAEIKVHLERLRTAIEGMPQGIYLLGADGRLLLSNARFAKLYKLLPEEVAEGMHKDDIAAACELTGSAVLSESVERVQVHAGSQVVAGQSVRTLEDGRTIVVTTAPTKDGGAVVVHEDITERQRAEAKIAYLAHQDALTGLGNRVLFQEKTDDALALRGKDSTVAVLYVDLDHFKAVNDTLGHPMGDRLLIMASKRLCACLREHDHVARLGGDEFAVVLNSNPTPAEAAALANRIIRTVGQPYEIDGHQVVIGVSIGIAMAPMDGDNAERLMKAADMALYRAKRDGRNTHSFFESNMDERMQQRRALELALRNAIASDALQLHYQPLINIQTGAVEEFEALLRWTDPVRGNVSPAQFIPLAEETGLINEISSWVLNRACKDAASWPEAIRVAVNISPLQFRTRTLVLNVMSALQASGLDAHRLELEITEGVLLHDTAATLQTLKQLQAIGVHIAMDDFGTGYSSLSYLRKFNFNKVKIDRSFVNGLDDTIGSRAIIRAVSGLCNSLGIEITAEGVETQEQLDMLRQDGCTQAQGYFLGRPAPLASVNAYFNDEPEAVTSQAKQA